MNFDLTLFALLNICGALTVVATVHSRIQGEEEHGHDRDEGGQELESSERKLIEELDLMVPGRRSLASLIRSMTSKPKGDVVDDAASAHARSTFRSRGVKIHNFYLWMLLDGGPDRGLKMSARTKKNLSVKDRLREDQLNQDHLKDRLPVRELRRRKIAGLFRANGSQDVSEVETETSDDSDGGGECPLAEDGQRLFFCPSPDDLGRHLCIDDENLCDRRRDCPNGEDEDPTACMFHELTRSYFRLVIETILRLIHPLSYSPVRPPRRRSVAPAGTAFEGYDGTAQRNGS